MPNAPPSVASTALSVMSNLARRLVPAPSAIAASLISKHQLFWDHSWVTLNETFAGFFLAVFIGVIAAAVLSLLLEITDLADGWLARKYASVTDFGKQRVGTKSATKTHTKPDRD